jgi:hypothetical protein
MIERIAAKKGYRVDESGAVFSPSGKKLRPAPDSKGYLRFNVRHAKAAWTCWVHRLQAFQKFGEAIYVPGTDVRHYPNPNPDNSIENIHLGTRSENLRDVPADERTARACRMNETKHGATRATIQGFLDSGKGVRETARLAGCSTSAVMAQKKRTNQR